MGKGFPWFTWLENHSQSWLLICHNNNKKNFVLREEGELVPFYHSFYPWPAAHVSRPENLNPEYTFLSSLFLFFVGVFFQPIIHSSMWTSGWFSSSLIAVSWLLMSQLGVISCSGKQRSSQPTTLRMNLWPLLLFELKHDLLSWVSIELPLHWCECLSISIVCIPTFLHSKERAYFNTSSWKES